MQAHIRLDAVDFRDTGVQGAGEQEEPLAASRADVEQDAAGVVLDQRCDFCCGGFARARAEPGPEAGEPVVFEGGEVGQGFDVGGGEEVEDCVWDVEG